MQFEKIYALTFTRGQRVKCPPGGILPAPHLKFSWILFKMSTFLSTSMSAHACIYPNLTFIHTITFFKVEMLLESFQYIWLRVLEYII